MARALKVWRTPIGFHDAYVAAPTQKAALAAWGSAHDLFARGQVELVTDAALTEAPLAAPGVVVKRLRGTAAEQVAALPATAKRAVAKSRTARPPTKATPRPPRPSRRALEQAEAAKAAAERRHDAEAGALAKEAAALEKRRRALEAAHETEAASLRKAIANARETYQAALADWEG